MFENANFKIVEMHIIDFYLNLQEVYDSSVRIRNPAELYCQANNTMVSNHVLKDISRSLELGIYMTEYSLCIRYVPFSWHFCGLPEGVPIILLTIASQRFESWTSAEHLFEGLQCLGEENLPHST